MSKGTLLSYFNKPIDQVPPPVVDQATPTPTVVVPVVESSKRKTNEEVADESNNGKRRKLSLSRVRHKQTKNDAIAEDPPAQLLTKQTKSEPLYNDVIAEPPQLLTKHALTANPPCLVVVEPVKVVTSPVLEVVNGDKKSLLSMMKLEREKVVQLEKSKKSEKTEKSSNPSQSKSLKYKLDELELEVESLIGAEESKNLSQITPKSKKLSLKNNKLKSRKPEECEANEANDTIEVIQDVKAEVKKKLALKSSKLMDIKTQQDESTLESKENSIVLESVSDKLIKKQSKRLSLKNNKLTVDIPNDDKLIKGRDKSPDVVTALPKFSQSSNLKSAKDVLFSQQRSEVAPKKEEGKKRITPVSKKEEIATKKETRRRKACNVLASSDEEKRQTEAEKPVEDTGRRRSCRVRKAVILEDSEEEVPSVKTPKPKASSKKREKTASDELVIVSATSPRKLNKDNKKRTLMDEARKILAQGSPDFSRRVITPPQKPLVPYPPWPKHHVRQLHEPPEHPPSTITLREELSSSPLTPTPGPIIVTYPSRVGRGCVKYESHVPASHEIAELVEYYKGCGQSKAEVEKSVVRKLDIYEDQETCPWSTIYCPQNYKHLIGNKSSNKQLYKWLEGWKDRLLKQRKKNQSGSSNDCYSSSEEFTDYEDDEGYQTYLNNVVLLVGPVGVGKSGAISACSNQLGYKLLELNPGSERTGKSVADLFSEASQSHSVAGQRGGADFTKLMKDIEQRHKAKKSKNGIDNFFGKKGGKSSEKKSEEKRKRRRSRKESKVQEVKSAEPARVEKMSVIVLEEIDIVFEVDKGFYTAIVALAKMALRPIILTSNNPLITLPTDAEFLTLHYRPPKAEMCVNNLSALSLSHSVPISPYQLQQCCVKHSLGKCLRAVEMCALSKNPQLTALDLGVEAFCTSDPAHWAPFLEQTQADNTIFSYTNYDKCLKQGIQSDDNKEELLALLKTHDTFCYLDQLTPSPSYPTHGFYPVEESRALVEEECREECMMSNVAIRASVEAELLSSVGGTLVDPAQARGHRSKLKDVRRLSLISSTQRSTAQDLLLTNHHDLSMVRGICRTETNREESHTKRRFLHYFHKQLKPEQRDRLAVDMLAQFNGGH